MRRYIEDYEERQPHCDRRAAQRKRLKKERRQKKTLKVLTVITITAFVVTCGIFGFSALQRSRQAQMNANPEVVTTSQTINTETSGGVLLTDVTSIVDQAMPSVVAITSRAYVSNSGYGGYSDIWNFFSQQYGGGQYYGSGQNMQGQEEIDYGAGSGTIVGTNKNELLILTSYHVVEGCSSLYVTFTDDTSVDGYIKSAAEDKDIAVVAVPLSDIPDATMQAISVAKLCTEDVEVGEGIIVIGNALGYGQSVITGVVSATHRSLDGIGGSLIQTDAAINAGNSGGCMLNAKGEIVGISEAKIARENVEGMCYAIPILENLELIEQLLSGGNGSTL